MDYQKASTIILLFYFVSSGLTVPLKRNSVGRVSTPEILDLEKQLKQQAGEDKKVSDDSQLKGMLKKPPIPVDALDPLGDLGEPIVPPNAPGKTDEFIESPPGSGELFTGPFADEYTSDVRKESMEDLFNTKRNDPALSEQDDEFLESVLDTLRKHPELLNDVLEDAAEEVLEKGMVDDGQDAEDESDDDSDDILTDRDEEDRDDAIKAERLNAFNAENSGTHNILPQSPDAADSLEDTDGKIYAEQQNAESRPMISNETPQGKSEVQEVDFDPDSADINGYGKPSYENSDFDRSHGRNPKYSADEEKRTEDSNRVKPNGSGKAVSKDSMQQQLDDLSRELSGKSKRHLEAEKQANRNM